MALDVALLLPDDVASLAREVNARLQTSQPGRLVLDATHLPHITLAQLFAAPENAALIWERVKEAGAAFGPIELQVRGVDDSSRTSMLVFEENHRLRGLHEALMDGVRDFEVAGSADAFFAEGDAPARERDVEWVSRYREENAYANYFPHVTLGHGPGAGPVEPFTFTAARLALCHLGRHCTCRVVLRERELTDR